MRKYKFRYGDRVIAEYAGAKFRGTIDYNSNDKQVLYEDGGYYIKPTDGTTFQHSRYDRHGNCWVAFMSVELDPDIPKVKLDEELFTL